MSGGHYIAYIRTRPHMKERIKELFNLSLNFNLNQLANVLIETNEEFSVKKALNKTENVDEIFNEMAKNSKWYYASDSSISLVNEKQVFNAEAYLLFYERIY